MTTPIVPTSAHRENMPAIDLALVEVRIAERTIYADGLDRRVPHAGSERSEKLYIAEALRADTEMMRALVQEVRRLTIGNNALREIVAAYRPASK